MRHALVGDSSHLEVLAGNGLILLAHLLDLGLKLLNVLLLCNEFLLDHWVECL